MGQDLTFVYNICLLVFHVFFNVFVIPLLYTFNYFKLAHDWWISRLRDEMSVIGLGSRSESVWGDSCGLWTSCHSWYNDFRKFFLKGLMVDKDIATKTSRRVEWQLQCAWKAIWYHKMQQSCAPRMLGKAHDLQGTYWKAQFPGGVEVEDPTIGDDEVWVVPNCCSIDFL